MSIPPELSRIVIEMRLRKSLKIHLIFILSFLIFMDWSTYQ